MKTYLGLIILFLAIVSCGGMASLAYPPNDKEIESAQNISSPIAFSGIHAERNSANGIDVMVTWKNISPDKTIKYCYMDIYLKNAVGDHVPCQITRQDSVTLKFTGPYPPGKTHWGGLSTHEAVTYHPNAVSIHIEKVWAEYMDGTRTDMIMVDGLISSCGSITEKLY